MAERWYARGHQTDTLWQERHRHEARAVLSSIAHAPRQASADQRQV